MKHSDYRASLEHDPLYIKGLKAFKTKFALSDAVLKARMDHNWSQAELAKRVGTRQANISRIEAGTSNPTLDLVHRLLEALNLTIIIAPVIESTSVAMSTNQYYDFDGKTVDWPSAVRATSTADNRIDEGNSTVIMMDVINDKHK